MTMLEEFEKPLFGSRPFIQFLCGEAPELPLGDRFLPEHLAPRVSLEDLHRKHISTAGLHPILALRFEPTFAADAIGDDLSEILGRSRIRYESYRIGIVSKDILDDILKGCKEILKDRGLQTYATEDGSATFFCANVRAGERLISIALGVTPIPGDPGISA